MTYAEAIVVAEPTCYLSVPRDRRNFNWSGQSPGEPSSAMQKPTAITR